MSTPIVTILIPIYNNEKYLHKALSSIVNQTYQNIEILIINDGSKDKSSEIIQQFAINDTRFVVINHKRNEGIVISLNEGLDKASGEYVARMDGDDISDLKRIELQINYMESHNDVGVLGTGIQVFGKISYVWQPPLTHEELKVKMFSESPIAHPSAMMRTAILRKYDLKYDPQYQYLEDYKLWVELSKHTKMANLPEVLLKYRIHPGQIGDVRSQIQKDSTEKLKLELLSEIISPLTNEFRNLHKKAMGWQAVESWKELNKLRDWYEKLLETNLRKSIYNEEQFKNLLAERWVGACYLSTKLGWTRHFYSLSSRPLRVQAIKFILINRLQSFRQYMLATIKRIW